MIEAVRDTFWELLNMKNAGNTPYRVGRPKVQSAIKTYLGMGTPNVSRTELTSTPQKTPNAQKRVLLPERKVQVPPAPRKRLLSHADRETARHEAKKLKSNAKLPNPGNEPDEGTWNEVLPQESEDLAASRLEQKLKHKTPTRKTTHLEMDPKHRQFLFLNLSDDSILAYITGQQPKWANLFTNHLKVEQNRLYFDNKPVLLKDERRKVIKESYFNPEKPVSIYAIHDDLRTTYANVTRRNVSNVLRTLETYQRLKTRTLPQKITGRIEVYSPGFLAADTVYPSTKNGWKANTIILTVVDLWSRYSGAYLLSDKKKETVAKAFEMYIDSFLQLSTSPVRSLMIDKGSELRGLDEIMERHCKKRPCVHRSLTGAPVNIIEGYNAQLQRMGQVYNEAGIVSDYGDVLYLVTNAINNQSRPDRMGYSPVELLQMNPGMRQEVNSNYKFRSKMGVEKDPLEPGTVVRILMLNRKEQVDAKTKGFPAHWSKDVFVIAHKRSVIKNPGVYKYFCQSFTTGEKVEGGRFRHELLELKGVNTLEDIDKEVPAVPLKKIPEKLYRVDGAGERGLYDPADDWEDFSGSD